MEKYYFNTVDNGNICTERCHVRNNGTMIGSAACNTCKHYIDSRTRTGERDWIICLKIKEAKQNQEKP